MGRPRITDNPQPVCIILDAHTVNMLDLIGRASPVGRPARAAMIRAAVEAFIEASMADPAIRDFVESRQPKPLKLHRAKATRGPQN